MKRAARKQLVDSMGPTPGCPPKMSTGGRRVNTLRFPLGLTRYSNIYLTHPFWTWSLDGVQAGKLRMREWVELFDEPRPSFEVLAISELPRVICRCIELLALFWQERVMYTVK